MNTRRFTVMALGSLVASLLVSGAAWAHADAAHVKVENAWARASVAGQQASGAFMRLTAQEPLKLVGVETPAALLSKRFRAPRRPDEGGADGAGSQRLVLEH